ncbi:MAG: P1 family peptidase [Acidimicrobiia bacterium]|nr:P1 family peptidase [Acidimicrobiia bacterium]
MIDVGSTGLTAITGIEVGVWTDTEALTGVTVVSLPEPNVAAFEARGAAPGTRETALLQPGMKVEMIQAICLAGGSAFGLGAADGVMSELAAEGRGHPTPAGPVPIVPSAIIFDLMVGTPTPPTSEAGRAAYLGRSADPVVSGAVGAGAGATVAKWRGVEHIQPSGQGSAQVEIDGATVASLAVVNAVGDVFTLSGEPLTGGPPIGLGPQWPVPDRQNTTLVVVATDAKLGRTDLMRLVVRAHDALAVCLRPAHTRYDGDAVFAVSCGEAEADLDALGEAAFIATGTAIENAVRSVSDRAQD